MAVCIWAELSIGAGVGARETGGDGPGDTGAAAGVGARETGGDGPGDTRAAFAAAAEDTLAPLCSS